MIASMTAFSRSAQQDAWGQAIWECRSVNHRYLDLSFKIPDNFREWEMEWRSLASQFLHRGKIECHLSFFASAQTAPAIRINTDLVEQLVSQCEHLAQYSGVKSDMKALELLRWPEVLQIVPRDVTPLQKPLTLLLKKALEELVQTRQREGTQLKQFLKNRLMQVEEAVGKVKKHLPDCLIRQKEKIQEKIIQLQVTVDPQRLEQEYIFYAQRLDVEEEIERLEAHVKEVHRALEEKGATGRRLDFLMQEMNREANTLAAKAAANEIVQTALDLKVIIEQMREQIQNVE